MAATLQTTRRLSESEYLAIERAAEWKSEFYDGEVFAMSGGTRAHAQITGNLIRELGNRLRGSPCTVFSADLRIKIEAVGLYTYPDLSVVCGEARTLTPEEDVLANPVLVAEVLSESTESYVRGRKFEFYRLIPNLQEYLIVSQWEPHLELFSRDDTGTWRLSEASGMAATLVIPALSVSIALSEVFAKVTFPPAPPPVMPPRRPA